MALRPRTYIMEKIVPLPRSAVWELLSRTEHLNRVIGLFPIRRRTFRPAAGALVQELTARVFGVVPMRWREHPFQWVRELDYSVVREYESGPIRRFYGGIQLADADGESRDAAPSTRLRLFAEFTPANAAGLVAIRLVGLRSMRNTLKYIESCVRLAGRGEGHLLPQAGKPSGLNPAALETLAARLSEATGGRGPTDRLRELLARGGDDEVVDMRPFRLADLWRADRNETLLLFLEATRLGLTNLSWHLICPNCRVSKTQTESLTGLRPLFHCELCGIEYEANFDRYVELCFSVHPQVRRAHKQVFCVGGPMITPHIAAQLELIPGRELQLPYPSAAGALRLRTLRTNRIVRLTPASPGAAGDEGLPPLALDAAGEWPAAAIAAPPPGAPLRLINRSAETVYVALERADWDDDTVTAARVTAMQPFRDLFSSEVLAPGQQVGIENVTILFSDLLGSTAFYEQAGDAHAYGQVRLHFDFLKACVQRGGGAIVKTIGDAVMAVFEQPEQAVAAALAIQTDLPRFNAGRAAGRPMVIKLGLYFGPAIVVQAGGVLDYFGRTVNLAARCQGTSLGGDVVVSRDCADRPGIRRLLERFGAERHDFAAEFKGVEGAMELTRLTLPAAAASITPGEGSD